MKLATVFLAACLALISGCSPQEDKSASHLIPYLKIPEGSRIRLLLFADNVGPVPSAQTAPLARAVHQGEFEGELISISESEVVIQPPYSRIPIHFGGTVVREITVLQPPRS